MTKFYHATVRKNLASILEKGLLINQTGKNAYGLNAGVDYEKIYNGKEEKKTVQQPIACIYVTSNLETAQKFKLNLKTQHPGEDVVILEIDYKNAKTHELIEDPEADNSFYFTKDIPTEWITVKEIKLQRERSTQFFSGFMAAPVTTPVFPDVAPVPTTVPTLKFK